MPIPSIVANQSMNLSAMQVDEFKLDDLVWSSDGQYIFVTNHYGIWRVNPNALNESAQHFEGYFPPLALSPDNQIAASLNSDGAIVFWDRDTGELLEVFYDPVNSLRGFTSLAFSPDGQHLAVGINGTTNMPPDGAVSVRDVFSGQEIGFFREVVSPAIVTYSSDGSQLITGGYSGLTIHDTTTWDLSRLGHGSYVTSLVASADGRWVAYWNWRSAYPIIIDSLSNEWVDCDLYYERDLGFAPGDVAFDSTRPNEIAIIFNSFLQFVDLDTCEVLLKTNSTVENLAFHPDGLYLAGIDRYHLHIFDVETLEIVASTVDTVAPSLSQ